MTTTHEYKGFVITVDSPPYGSKMRYWEVGSPMLPRDGRLDFGYAMSEKAAIKAGKQSADDYKKILGI